MLGLDPDSVIGRIQAEGRPFVLPNLRQTAAVGTLGFMIVGVAAFSLWAFAGRTLGEALGPVGFYALIATVLFGGGALVLKPIIIGRNLGRFAIAFGLGFVLLAIVWIVGDRMRLPHRLGEIAGVLLGSALLAVVLVAAFGAWRFLVASATAMVLGHSGGYFIADQLFQLEPLKNQFGMLLWGLVYGAGLGAGVSIVIFFCQTEIRHRLTLLVHGDATDQGDI